MTDKSERPNIIPERSTFEKIVQALCLFMLICYIVMTAASYASLPEIIPKHFNFSGVPDGYGSKATIFLMPIVTVGLYALITVLERYPRIFNYGTVEITEQNAKRLYRMGREFLALLKTELVGTFFYLDFATIKTAKGEWHGLGQWADPVILGVLFGTLIVFIALLYRHKNG